ncbi:UDP-3-O-(3-hydroxymyristoyl)glucosamine N-acyltransferase [Brackiella oedipodis]|uniref:UDP-3-O-(3-hydroxymyristoyl)glucosamine N-acyltransferase n=1 Tax=Brackiella oedipodis TaxID=124225 RepID=UPI0004916515|nr:UDP-3-O-(3-hydroxymyristoyl)glucosamine N-acyltransferase [Brackiella oedipodis]
MLILQEPDKAILLDALLEQINTQGLDWELKLPAGAQMPLISGIGALDRAQAHEISFLANPKLAHSLASTQASAVILPPQALQLLPEQLPFAVVLTKDPYLFYARLVKWFAQKQDGSQAPSISPHAVIGQNVVIEDDVSIGHFTIIEDNSIIKKGARIGSHCFIGPDCVIGSQSLLHSHVSLYKRVKVGERCIIHSQAVIGGDGFGFAPDSTQEKGAWCKIEQLGGVTIGNDVEIGACTTIDRGALSDTLIGNGVKLDNLIMIGHNCEIGDHTAMAACVGMAGSTKVGKRCIIAGAAMFAGHLTLVDDVYISGATGVMSSIKKPGQYTSAFPITDHATWRKNAPLVNQLSQLRRRIQQLEKKEG